MKRAGLAKVAKKGMYLYFTSEFKNLPLLNEYVTNAFRSKFSRGALRSPKNLVAVASTLTFVEEFLKEEPVINDEDVVGDFLRLFFLICLT